MSYGPVAIWHDESFASMSFFSDILYSNLCRPPIGILKLLLNMAHYFIA